MTHVSAIGSGACEARLDALRAEFGVVLAARIIDAEELDFLWDARVSERYLGQHFGSESDVGAAPQSHAASFSRSAVAEKPLCLDLDPRLPVDRLEARDARPRGREPALGPALEGRARPHGAAEAAHLGAVGREPVDAERPAARAD